MEIRLRAERRSGQLLEEMQERGERSAQGGDRKSKYQAGSLISKLPDLGMSKNQSARWQRMAEMTAEKFENILAVC